jgi:hypothetical protein
VRAATTSVDWRGSNGLEQRGFASGLQSKR